MRRLAKPALAALAAALLLGVLTVTVKSAGSATSLPPFLDRHEHGYTPISGCIRHPHATSFQTQNTDLIVGDSIAVAGSSRGCVTPQNEPSAAVNPADPLNLVAGSNDYRICCDGTGRNDGTGWAYTSLDGGKRWRNVLLPGLTVETGGQGVFRSVDSAGDPSVAFAADGSSVYYANIVFSRTAAASGIAVSRSDNGGRSWSKPTVVAYTNTGAIFNDKEWIAAGPHGELAVTWTAFIAIDPWDYVAPIMVSISRDRGVHWSPPAAVSDLAHVYNQGSIPMFTRQGGLDVVFETAHVDAVHAGRNFAWDDVAVAESSGAHPARFGLTHELARDFDGAGCFPPNPDQRATLTGMQFRFSSLPAAAINANGTVAVTWADGQRGCTGDGGYWPKHTDAQVKLLYLNGAAHSAVQIVSSGGDKAMPAVAWTRDGLPVVSFYTRSYASCDTCLDYAYASPRDGFAEHRLSDGSSDTFEQFGGAFIGDYSALTIGSDGAAHPFWVDSRGANQDILTQTFQP